MIEEFKVKGLNSLQGKGDSFAGERDLWGEGGGGGGGEERKGFSIYM